jgi:hypothetical protein
MLEMLTGDQDVVLPDIMCFFMPIHSYDYGVIGLCHAP